VPAVEGPGRSAPEEDEDGCGSEKLDEDDEVVRSKGDERRPEDDELGSLFSFSESSPSVNHSVHPPPSG
jgi:hypothetical protein